MPRRRANFGASLEKEPVRQYIITVCFLRMGPAAIGPRDQAAAISYPEKG